MRTEHETTRIVRSWLDEGVAVLPDRVLDAVLDQLPATHQRQSLWHRRAFADARVLRLGAIAAALTFAVVVALNGGPMDGPGPPASPTPAPSPTATPVLATHTLVGYPVGLTFEAPDDWGMCIYGPTEQAVCASDVSDQSLVVSFLIIENVVIDPCGLDVLDPPLGDSVDDLVTALTSLPGFTPSEIREITFDGFAGKEFTIIAPFGVGCELRTWATAERINGVGSGERNHVRILDVDGTRVVIASAYHPQHGPAEVAALDAIMDSVDLTP